MEPRDVILLACARGYSYDEQGNIYGVKGFKLKLYRSKNSQYLNFAIRVDDCHKNVPVHRFIAYHIYGDELFEADCVRHLNGNKNDNRPINLAIGSLSDNFQDNDINWRKEFAKRGAHLKRKLNDDQVRCIKEKLRDGISGPKLAAEYNVAITTIQQIKEGKSYSWILI